jgi:hypothetical protein
VSGPGSAFGPAFAASFNAMERAKAVLADRKDRQAAEEYGKKLAAEFNAIYAEETAAEEKLRGLMDQSTNDPGSVTEKDITVATNEFESKKIRGNQIRAQKLTIAVLELGGNPYASGFKVLADRELQIAEKLNERAFTELDREDRQKHDRERDADVQARFESQEARLTEQHEDQMGVQWAQVEATRDAAERQGKYTTALIENMQNDNAREDKKLDALLSSALKEQDEKAFDYNLKVLTGVQALVEQGFGTQQISKSLGLSEATVEAAAGASDGMSKELRAQVVEIDKQINSAKEEGDAEMVGLLEGRKKYLRKREKIVLKNALQTEKKRGDYNAQVTDIMRYLDPASKLIVGIGAAVGRPGEEMSPEEIDAAAREE